MGGVERGSSSGDDFRGVSLDGRAVGMGDEDDGVERRALDDTGPDVPVCEDSVAFSDGTGAFS